jgi:hypothetical protein
VHVKPVASRDVLLHGVELIQIGAQEDVPPSDW